MTTYDVAVVGAGPAGAWAATLLSSRGARVVMFDPSHPREKPCGGGITGRALALVQPRARLAGLQVVSIRSARFLTADDDEGVVVDLVDGPLSQRRGEEARLVVASRSHFDSLLLDTARDAGTHLVEARVTRIERVDAAFQLTTAAHGRFAARAIVGADGTNSIVRRTLASPFRRDQLSIATGVFAHGATSHEIVVAFTADPPGYLWSFPRPDHLAVGICAQADAGVTAGDLRARAVRWIARDSLAPRPSLVPYSWPIPSLSPTDLETTPITGPGWMLVGDAAGLVDPITREGIYFALRSAACAADALVQDSGASSLYRDQVRQEIISELIRAARLKRRFFQPAFTRLMLDGLRRSAGIRRVMADLVAGVQPYRGLRRRLARTFEWTLAWRLLRALGDARG